MGNEKKPMQSRFLNYDKPFVTVDTELKTFSPELQIEKVQQDIEGMLNDFESGETEKEETIVLLRNYVYDRCECAVKNSRGE